MFWGRHKFDIKHNVKRSNIRRKILNEMKNRDFYLLILICMKVQFIWWTFLNAKHSSSGQQQNTDFFFSSAAIPKMDVRHSKIFAKQKLHSHFYTNKEKNLVVSFRLIKISWLIVIAGSNKKYNCQIIHWQKWFEHFLYNSIFDLNVTI